MAPGEPKPVDVDKFADKKMGQVSPLAPFLSIAATFGRARVFECRCFQRDREPTQVLLQSKSKLRLM